MKNRRIHWLAVTVFLGLIGSARAQTLVAVADSYDAPADQTLVVEAPGVLENDTDSRGGNLPPTATAELLGDVTHGTLSLSPDGGFTYTPDGGSLGTDPFTYRVVDGADSSNPATVTLTVSGCSGAVPVFTCWIESSYLAKVAELGYGSFQEGFEDDAVWSTTRTSPAPSVTSQGITWEPNHAANGVRTGSGPARSGLWGFFSLPHGITTGALTDPQRDGFIGTAPGGLVAVGGWLESNTGGARVQFQLDGGVPIGFDDPTVTSLHKFFGVIDTSGFTTFEIYETEGVVGDQEFIFADDFTFGDATPPINNPPVAVADAFTVDENSVDNPLAVLANDTDPDGDALIIGTVGVPDQGGSVSVNATGDGLLYTPAADFAGTETFTYTASDGIAQSLPATVTMTVTAPPPQISISDVTVMEGQGGSDAVFTVWLSHSSSVMLTVDFDTSPDTATADVDYMSASGTLTIPPGQTQQTVTILVYDDLLLEPDETFFLQLSNASDGVIVDGLAIATIVDDERCLGPNLLANPSAEEPLVGGEIPGWTEVVGTDWQPRAINPLPFDGAAYFFPGAVPAAELRQDVDVSSYASFIDDGQQAFAFEGYVRTGDGLPDDTARIVVDYRDATNTVSLFVFDSGEVLSPSAWQLIADESTAPVGTRRIRVSLIANRPGVGDNDAYFDALTLQSIRTPALSVSDATVQEGDVGAVDALFDVELSCAADYDITFDYATADGTAVQDFDYEPIAPTPLTIPGGAIQAVVPVAVLGDSEEEQEEDFFLRLTNVSGAAPVKSEARGVIVDDDRPTVVLRVNGQHPDPPVVLTSGPTQLTLSMDPGKATDSLNWYYGILIQSQVYWVTSSGLSTTPAPLVTMPPIVLQDVTLFDSTLPNGTGLTFLFFLTRSAEIVSLDYITVGVSAGPSIALDRSVPRIEEGVERAFR
jgi:hypothetical protein